MKKIRAIAAVIAAVYLLSMSGCTKTKSGGIDFGNVSRGLSYDESDNSWSSRLKNTEMFIW